MNFIADESVDQPIVDYLRKNNYTVISIAEMEPGLSGLSSNKKTVMKCYISRPDPI